MLNINHSDIMHTFYKFKLKVEEHPFRNCYGTFLYSPELYTLLKEEYPSAVIQHHIFLTIDIEFN